MPHWIQLRAAIDSRGLGSLVSARGEEVVEKMRRQADGTAQPILDFDPLMFAHNRIVENGLRVAGLALMEPEPNGTPRCPICFLATAHAARCKSEECTGLADDWIDRAADEAAAVVERQRAEGLA